MAIQNASDQMFDNNSDGFDIAGGSTSRKLTVSGGNIGLAGGTGATLTMPTITSSVPAKKVSSTTSSATPSPSGDADFNELHLTAQAANMTIAAPSGTPLDTNKLIIRIEPTGTYTIAYNAIFQDITASAPTATTSGKTIVIGCEYNATVSYWQIIAVTVQP
jgi:hypothetical protein